MLPLVPRKKGHHGEAPPPTAWDAVTLEIEEGTVAVVEAMTVEVMVARDIIETSLDQQEATIAEEDSKAI